MMPTEPSFYVVNFAHQGLNLKHEKAAIRIVGAFGTRATAQKFSQDFTTSHGLDCYLLRKGAPMIVPRDYGFQTEPARAVKKLEDIQASHKDDVQKTRDEFREYMKAAKELRQKEKDSSGDDKDYAQNKLKEMLRLRNKDLNKSKAMMSGEMFAIAEPVASEAKGAFKHAVITCMEDKSEEGEHAITVHGVYETVEQARVAIETDLSKQILDNDLHVVDMYQWLAPGLSFCEHIMEGVERKYRDSKQDEIMQYHLRKRQEKRKEMTGFYALHGIEEPKNAPIHAKVE